MPSMKPLSGIRVLDFTAMPPGGFCTVILADLGAEVIRVEPPAQKGNAKRGSMETRGFGYAQAHAENERIIWCAVTGFGQSGPYAERGGHDVSYLAHSGLLSALSPDPFWQPGISLSLQAGAVAAVIGIQSALLERSRTSKGAFLDISLAEASSWYLTCGIRMPNSSCSRDRASFSMDAMKRRRARTHQSTPAQRDILQVSV